MTDQTPFEVAQRKRETEKYHEEIVVPYARFFASYEAEKKAEAKPKAVLRSVKRASAS